MLITEAADSRRCAQLGRKVNWRCFGFCLGSLSVSGTTAKGRRGRDGAPGAELGLGTVLSGGNAVTCPFLDLFRIVAETLNWGQGRGSLELFW